MEKIRKLAGVALLGLVLLVSAGCGVGDKKSDAPAFPEKITLKFGHPVDEKNPWHLGAVKFKEIVEKNSNNRIEIKIYPNDQLGREKDLITSIQNGTADIGIFGESLASFGASKAILLATPYLLKDSDQLQKVAGGEIGKEIETQIVETVKIRPIAYFERGTRNLTSNRAIKTPDDLNGFKIGIPDVPLFVDTWRAFGAKPVPTAPWEIYSGLKLGNIDGEENSYGPIKSDKLFEVQEFLNKTGHVRSWIYVCVGERRFRSLPEDLKQIVLAAAKEMQRYEHEQFLKEEQSLESFLKNKMTFVDTDIEAFRAKSKDAVLAKFDDDQKALYNKIIRLK